MVSMMRNDRFRFPKPIRFTDYRTAAMPIDAAASPDRRSTVTTLRPIKEKPHETSKCSHGRHPQATSATPRCGTGTPRLPVLLPVAVPVPRGYQCYSPLR
eukprot:GHVU01081226.1.p1 GENE.GHVU01081226.1~~GHVU01081226.1.p1  ORF type:complete len:100 (-),score=1.98 GHVU01081226.1:681-980(-)